MTKKEQLSKSTEIPKHRNALIEKYETEPEKTVTTEATKLPKPTGWRMLVLPFKMNEKTKGGLILAETSLEKQQVASQCGLPDCYRDKERYPEGPWCKEKDWVIFARYAGSRIKIEGGEVRMLNDDEILATVDNPEDIIHEF
jgi:chaperonin GroES